MGTNINSGLVSISGNITFDTVALTPLFASRVSAGTTTLGTVPAGKVWRIYSAAMSSSGATTTGTTKLFAHTNEILNYNFVGGSLSFANSVNFSPHYVKISAGQTITLVTSANNNYSDATVFYEEVAA